MPWGRALVATYDRLDRAHRVAREAERGQDEAAVYRDRARRLGLAFVPSVHLDGGATVLDAEGIREGRIVISRGGAGIAYIAPREDVMPATLGWLARSPELRRRLCVATPTAIRTAMVELAAEDLAAHAVGRIAHARPDLSARGVLTRPQAAAIAVFAVAAGLGGWFAPFVMILAVSTIGAAFFFGVSILRLLAADYAKTRKSPDKAVVAMPVPDSELPTYTILVPLYREAELVPDVVVALDALDWPRDKLDIKLLLEADDEQTIAAARFAARGVPYETIVVPSIGPRTKPKALAFAMPLVRGTFVTVYDAEDRPHPKQLRESFAAFHRAGPDLACLQSPLVIDNAGEGWLPLSFAVEYAGLFDALLPTLAAYGMPLPLGGTSNHFRRSALEAVGGWDPYNVTEDADLGLRFSRFGFRTGTLDLPTLEEAPTRLRTWFNQRTRWSKGWIQTWLVHMRQPARLVRDLGPRGILGFSLFTTGLIVSQLIYPLYLLVFFLSFTDPMGHWVHGNPFTSAVLGVNLFNPFAAFAAMALLSVRALRVRGRTATAAGVFLLPVFWFLVSLSCYRALFQLATRPHHWAKTPHRRRRGRPRAFAAR